MSEEEKKAIKYLQHLRKYVAGSDEEEFVVLVLNLIEKQNNRLEQLKKEDKELKSTLKCTQDSWFEDTKKIEDLKDYIPKSVIREKIEELENNKSYLSKFNDWKEKDYTNEDVIRNCIEVLEELLGGSNE